MFVRNLLLSPYVRACVARSSPLCCTQVRNVSGTQLPKMGDCKHVPSVYDGLHYEDVRNQYKTIVSPSLKLFYKKPLLLHEGKGQWLWDHTGKRYLDMFAGIATVSVGYSHPKIAAAVSEQMSRLNHAPGVYMHPRLHEYVQKLVAKFPRGMDVVYLTNSGSEANELAYLMARVYTGQQNILSLRNAYHGGTFASVSSSAMSNWKYPVPQPPGYIHTVFPDVYRGPWGGSHCRDSPVQVKGRSCECAGGECRAAEKSFQDFKDIFHFSLSGQRSVAAFIAESIQGIGGTVQYPRTFLKKVHEYVRHNGGVCIADEVQTGFGRTGERFWGFEDHGLLPDIVTMAKGVGNGFPLGAVVTNLEIADALKKSTHFNTFGGNPIACAAGSAVLDIIEEEGLQENAHDVGTHMLKRLSTLLSDFPNIVGDVRGKGLMIGVELVADPKTKDYLPAERVAEIFEDIKDMGVLVGRGGICSNVLRIKPPMCVTKEDADFAFEIIRKALERDQSKHSRA